MKRLIYLLVSVLLFASCTVFKSSIQTTAVKAPVFSATAASLQVAETPITFTYTPSEYEKRHSSLETILENASYQALVEKSAGDVLIQLSYKVEGKGFGRTVRKIKRITITGYPAKYVDFRTPDENDRENFEVFYTNPSTHRSTGVITIKKN